MLDRVDYPAVGQFGRLVGFQVGIHGRFHRFHDAVRGGQFDGPRRPYPALAGNPYLNVVHREQPDTPVDFPAFADVMLAIRVEQFVQAFSRVHFGTFHRRIRSDLVFEAGGQFGHQSVEVDVLHGVLLFHEEKLDIQPMRPSDGDACGT